MNDQPNPQLEAFLSGDADETDLRLLVDQIDDDHRRRRIGDELRFLGMLRAAAIDDAQLVDRAERTHRLALTTTGPAAAARSGAVMARIASANAGKRRPRQTAVLVVAIAALAVFGFFLMPQPPPAVGTITAAGVGYDLQRDGQTLLLTNGAELQHGDRIVGGAATESLNIRCHDGTTIVATGTIDLACRRAGPGQHYLLETGSLTLDVATQPPGHPLIVITPLARATVVGTTLEIDSKPAQTRLQVREGAVLFANLHEDRRVVEANQFAVARRGETKLTGSETTIAPPPAVAAAHSRWQKWSTSLSNDPDLVVHYTFEPDSADRGWLVNEAPPPEDPIFPRNLDGRIHKCTWSDGRFPGLKSSLLFQQDAYVNCGRDPAIPTDGPITCMAWFKPLLLHRGWTGIVTTGIYGWGIQLNKEDNSVNFYYKTELGHENARSYNTVDLNQWHFAVGVFDGSHTRIYLNGKLLSKFPVAGTKSPFLDPLMIGGNFTNQPARSFQGWIDEVAVLRRAFTDAEIAAAYSAGRPD